MSSEKKHLIVTGVARSGTTALGELLNAHPRVCLGIERFKFQYLRKNVYSPAFFERDRFFDFRPDDTNLDPALRPAWKPVYDSIAQKWDDAEIIGDKVPDLLPILADFIAANPDFKYICILRNLKDVALSWQTRADKPRDSWPAGKGFEAACASWAEQMQTLHDLMLDRPMREKILMLDYDTMYDDPVRTAAALSAFLGLAPNGAFLQTLHQHAAFVTARKTRKVPPQFIEPYKAVSQGHIRGLRKISDEQIATWADTFHRNAPS
ncbi:sulfotransferase family protein [Oceaniglobus trochenteri]|uniref:sulfotransferase family protein n=1 Tax=Oceaniglobus trochenteri TaxID=2763260 RepID=UPI001CFF7240|nr:sulfotransferase [Oceaniglobus trochenteri]